jgi:predicted nucleotidyltransferase
MSTFILKMSTTFPPDPLATKLFGKLRRELLALLYRNPERSLYLRELVRMTGASPGTLQREVGELTDVGLLTKSRRGRQVFYQANRSHPVFQDLRGLLDKTVGTVDVLRGALTPLADRIDGAVLFGSTAKGAATGASDVDVLVVGSAEFAEVSDALSSAEKTLGREVNPVVYSRAEFGRRLREGGRFVESVLGSPHVPLIGELPNESGPVARDRRHGNTLGGRVADHGGVEVTDAGEEEDRAVEQPSRRCQIAGETDGTGAAWDGAGGG